MDAYYSTGLLIFWYFAYEGCLCLYKMGLFTLPYLADVHGFDDDLKYVQKNRKAVRADKAHTFELDADSPIPLLLIVRLHLCVTIVHSHNRTCV